MRFSQVVTTAMVSLKNNRVALFQALFIPVLISMLLSITPVMGLGTLERFIINILDMIINTVIAVNTYRIILLGTGAVNKWGMVWSRRETRYLLITFGFSMAAGGIIFLAFYISGKLHLDLWLTLFVFGLVISYVLSRLYLVLPSVAIGNSINFKHSWVLTMKHQLLVWLSIMFSPIIAIIIFIPLVYLPYSVYFVDPLLIAAMILTAALVSVAYQYISGLENDSAIIEA